ncbi:MAG: DUF177 domain-containing protein [Clostridiales bacterium]|jgi:uncharacterized protein|nr:DUF177 domain-containing protein [Clostridiales bacterium]
MWIDVKDLPDGGVISLVFTKTFDAPDREGKAEIKFIGSLTRKGDAYSLKLNCEGHFAANCDGCLIQTEVPLNYLTEEIFSKAASTEPEGYDADADVWTFSGQSINISESLSMNFLLNFPLYIRCNENCKGLCPTCGKNLNEGPCGCLPELDPRLKILRNFKE